MSREHHTAGQRQLRVGEELRHALARILERGELRDPALAEVAVTVTEVRVGPDLRQATVFIVPLGGGKEAEIISALGRARGFLRRQIASSVYLKFVPDLHFRIDHTFEEAQRIARVLQRPEVRRDLERVDEPSADDDLPAEMNEAEPGTDTDPDAQPDGGARG